jgi:YidC/Oxa1 family membrane protein insertase
MDISAITYSVFIPLLNSIHEFTKSIGLQSFGWSIVLLTAIVKLVLTPLTYKQIKSTKHMQVIQPQLKKLQETFKKKEEQYKNSPEKLQEARLEFQGKMMNFYKDNGVNPLGGCLPLLVQMPILLGLFWTFSGAPFQEKPIFIDVKVVSQAEAHKKQIKAATKGEIFVDAEGSRARVIVNTGGLTMTEGEEFTLESSKIAGEAELNPELIKWNFFGDKSENDYVDIVPLEEGKVKILAKKAGGSAKIQAILPAALENDSFFFIKDFGSTGVIDKKTGKLNVDILILVILFGISIWLSSKLNAPKLPPPSPGIEEDPQVAMQRSMATTMPVMMTAMMFLIPLPAGALLYMIVSGFIQSGQTYFALQRYDKKFASLKIKHT